MPRKPRVLVFAGSARTGSYNKMLARIAAAAAKAAGAEVTLIDLRDFPMPLYDADLHAREGFPEPAKRFKQLLIDHDALIIASPENNSSVSALLKNVIDWASRRSGDEKALAAFDGKVAAIMSASTGALGGLRGLYQLRWILSNIKVLVIPDQRAVARAASAFDASGNLTDEDTRAAVEAIAAKLVSVAAKLTA
jgi:chromate reductase